MPHLSPMIWALSPLIFMIFILFFFMSSMWWAQMPKFPKSYDSNLKTLNKWNWS
uniref:ATP synthase F0 subunit 8 n=1 Tax=Terebellides stroemii TaxID=1037239 RepID=B3TJW8_9ANNE|nr:ATP synthase F0 subunit 8 [Terebellides stroemii]ABW76474.1 ATP synthase F0 subunit 8 [Terebellides stroemii]